MGGYKSILQFLVIQIFFKVLRDMKFSALITLAFCTIAFARKRDGSRDGNKRPMKNKVSNHGFKMESVEEIGGIGFTSLEIGFTTKGFPRWRVDYTAKAEAKKIRKKFRVGIAALVEYNSTI